MKPIKEINSENNPSFKLLLKLTKARGVKKQGFALLSGSKQVREVLDEFPEHCDSIIFSDRHEFPSGINAPHIRSYRLNTALFQRIDIYDTGQPILKVYTNPFPKWDHQADPSGCVLCIPFQDPSNVGAVIRSAAAFGVLKIVILKEAAHPFHHKSLRVAGSAVFRAPIFEGPSLFELNPARVPIITLSPGKTDVKDFTFPNFFCLVPGLEGPGLPDHFHNTICLSIPMEPGVESINSAMATGIVLYLWRNQVSVDATGQ